MNKTGIIILAAGSSVRLGQPKQLLPYRGSTLIERAAGESLTAGLYPVIVVTGAFTDRVADALEGIEVRLIHNTRWQEGMGTGIAVGINALRDLQPDASTVIIAVCDQPHLSADLLQTLISRQASAQKGIVACTYSDTVGTPALFTQSYFTVLSELTGNQGARKILLRYQDDLASVPFPEGAIDIDTPEDYRALLSGKK